MKLTQKDYDGSSNKIPTCSRCKKPMKPFINGSYICTCGTDFAKIKASGTGGGSSNKMKKLKQKDIKWFTGDDAIYMEISKQDLINKIETLNGYMEYFSKKYEPFDTMFPAVIEEVNIWVEEVRTKEVKFIND